MARNISVDQVEFIGIYKLCAYNADRWQLGAQSYDEQAAKMVTIPQTTISHEAHLSHNSIGASMRADLTYPNQEVGLLVLLGSASALDRPGNTRCLFFRDELYYILTWTDVAGSRHGRQSGLRRTQQNRLVFFLQKVDRPDHAQLLLDLIADKIRI